MWLYIMTFIIFFIIYIILGVHKNNLIRLEENLSESAVSNKDELLRKISDEKIAFRVCVNNLILYFILEIFVFFFLNIFRTM